ncbi:MAG: mannose-6-phosphate isomerase, class I [Desulfosoma sp.]
MTASARLIQCPYRLKNPVRHYEWGERGPSAFIARLLKVTSLEKRPYAELWVGAHPSDPSFLEFPDGSKMPLPEAITRWPLEIMGSRVTQDFGGSWPFLFKILSAAEPLSIQAHPDATQARLLHLQDPLHYPDPNPKPEIAVALSRFKALLGFKPVEGWYEVFRVFSEVATFLEADSLHSDRGSGFLKKAFSRLLKKAQKNKDALAFTVTATAKRIREAPEPFGTMADLFQELMAKYGPADVGLLVLLFLNPVELLPGQAIFLAPGLPHAYLAGNIVECMTNSDNVIRLGLTPKHKDFNAMLQVLHFEPYKPLIMTPSQGSHTAYKVPCEAFEIHRWILKARTKIPMQRPEGPEILFIIQGRGEIVWNANNATGSIPYHKGQSFLIPAFLPDYTVIPHTQTLAFTAQVPSTASRP